MKTRLRLLAALLLMLVALASPGVVRSDDDPTCSAPCTFRYFENEDGVMCSETFCPCDNLRIVTCPDHP